MEVVNALAVDARLPARYVDHLLVGELARRRNRTASRTFDFSDGRY